MTTTERRPQTASGDHTTTGTQCCSVVAGPKLLADQSRFDIQGASVGEDPNSVTTGHASSGSQSTTVGGDGPNPRSAQIPAGNHGRCGTAAQTPEPAMHRPDTIGQAPVRVPNSPAAIHIPPTMEGSPPGISDSATDQTPHEAQPCSVGGAQGCRPEPAIASSASRPDPLVLVDDTLAVLANQVGDLETFRKACASQLGALTRTGPDKDGNLRGWGLPADHPAAIQQEAVVAGVKALEDAAIKALEKHLKRSPMGPWVLAQKGLGFKTIARLLAATGDPYWNSLHDRPRTVAELRSYCGYGDATAQRKVKGLRVGWSPEARMRGFVCSSGVKQGLRKPCYSLKDEDDKHIGGAHVEGCVCSPYRVLYDTEKARYVGSVHHEECHRCTGKGKPPAPIGSPRKAAHIDAIALRAVTKRLLKNLWHEAKRLHELPDGHGSTDDHRRGAVGAST